jgi:hypothetical protein
MEPTYSVTHPHTQTRHMLREEQVIKLIPDGQKSAATALIRALRPGQSVSVGVSHRVTREVALDRVTGEESIKDIAAKWSEGNVPEPNPDDEFDA